MAFLVARLRRGARPGLGGAAGDVQGQSGAEERAVLRRPRGGRAHRAGERDSQCTVHAEGGK